MRRRLFDAFLLLAHVDSVEQVAPRLRRITLGGPELAGLTWAPGQHVRVQVADSHATMDWLVGIPRTYSVWEYDGTSLDLVVYDHGETNGPGAQWGLTVEPGDEVRLLKPEGRFVLAEDAAFHLFAGEETAQVAVGPMLRALPEGVPAIGRFEVDSPDQQLDLGPGRTGSDIGWAYRHGRTAASSETLVDAVRKLDLPDGDGVAYLAGEAKTIQMLRRHLVDERGWPRRNVITKPFWTPGRKGLD